MKFGQLILRRIVKIVGRGQIRRLKCTEIDFGASPDPLAEKGRYF